MCTRVTAHWRVAARAHRHMAEDFTGTGLLLSSSPKPSPPPSLSCRSHTARCYVFRCTVYLYISLYFYWLFATPPITKRELDAKEHVARGYARRAHPAASLQVCVRSSNSRGSGWKSAGLAAGGGHVWQLPPSQQEPGGRVQCRPPGVQQALEVGAPLIASTAQSSPVPSGPGSVQSAAPPGKDHVAAVQASQPQAKQAPRQ